MNSLTPTEKTRAPSSPRTEGRRPPLAGPPLFSVIMPIYNGSQFLGEALASLRAQTPFEGGYEVIAADDGSTDGSRELLEEAAKTLPLRIIEGARTGNWVASTNKAMREAKGSFILHLHQDDRYRPGRLRTLAAAIAAHPDHGFFVNATAFVGSDGRNLGLWRPGMSAGYQSPADACARLLVQNTFAVPGVCFRRALLDEAGFMDDTWRYTGDWDHWLRLALREGVMVLPDVLSEFRVHGGSQTVGFAERIAAMRKELEAVLALHRDAVLALLPPGRRQKWRRLARLGVETNVFLASAGTGGSARWKPFLRALFGCPPHEWFLYARYAALVARSLARVRAGFLG